MEPLKSFFQPSSVVVVGASRDSDKLGYGVARNVIGSGFPGEVYLVNPGGGELFGRELITSVEVLPEEIDLGLIVVPPKVVPQTLLACSQKRIKSFIILTGGFSEIGLEGQRIEEELSRVIKSEGLRVIGPNCIGILDTQLPLDTTFIQPPMPQPGNVAFITHSGALGAAMIDWSKEQGFAFSRVISLGNQVDITETDVLEAIAQKDDTRVVTMYLETISDGRKFIEVAAEASQYKPVVVMKTGRSDAGKKAAASHTGALAGSDQAFEAAFRRAGLLRAASIEEMFSWAKLFSTSSLPKGNRVAILTNAGGPGVTAADAVANHGLVMATLGNSTLTELGKILPQAAAVGNPVDMLASASPEVYAACLDVLIDDPVVDMVMVIAPPPPMFTAEAIAESLTPVIERSSKPVVVSFMGSHLVTRGVDILREKKIPEFSFPEAGISAMGAAWRYGREKSRESQILEYTPAKRSKVEVKNLLSDLQHSGTNASSESAFQLLAAYDIPVMELHYADQKETAARIAEEIGFPVALKIAMPGVSHKSDLGGVMLNLENGQSVEAGYDQLKQRVEQIGGLDSAKFGVHVQKMAPKGQEVIIGAVRDNLFGPMVMFGAGGTEVEGLGDVTFAIGPLTADDLDYVLSHTWGGRRLKGFRQQAPADSRAVREAIIRLAQLMLDHPEIEEIEVNPFVVLPEGQGCWAVDARMVIKSGHLEMVT